ncbi:MAG: PE family protein [Mycobacteriaceae bacterium]|nr:PE family protein [Mycobacteriaceae bacterium]
MDGHFAFDPALAAQVAQRLDALAARLETDLAQTRKQLTVVPAAVDDVSKRATKTFNAVSAQYQQAYGNGVRELRKLAATLRSQSTTVRSTEARHADHFTKLTGQA